MYKIRLLFIGFLFFSIFSSAQQFNDLSQKVPFDKSFRTGVLPNGMTYYIRQNKQTEGRASFYIYQNVGAVLENDKQDGLAHFLEHMAFNGTKTFPGKSMLNMLELNGVKFGKDINAYTTQNETVYNISSVPTANQGLVDSCLMILHDWCDDLTLDVGEINAERGVITEEWRTRHDLGFRIRSQIGSALYNGTVYAERDVIGDLNVIKNFDPKDLRSFYHDWYRTDLQAIAVVGDIDVDAIEKQVIKLFAAIPKVKNPKERPFITIPDNEKPLYVLAKDKENKDVAVSVVVRYRDEPTNTLAGLRQNYVSSFFNALMKGRFSEIAQDGKAPFASASVELNDLVRGYKSFNIKAVSKTRNEARAFKAACTELQRVVQYGFTQGELDRLKTNMLVAVENRYKKKDQIDNDTYCKSIKTAYLNKSSIIDPEFNYAFSKEIIQSITVEEVSAEASKYLTDINRVYTVIAPEKEDKKFISKGEIDAILASMKEMKLEAYVDTTPDNINLLSTTPKGGTIVGEKAIKEFNAVEWTLSNGAKVVYRFADFQKESVELSALSDGGSSLYEVKDIPSVSAMTNFVSTFGIGRLDPIEYKKVMTGKTAQSNFAISNFGESISAVSTSSPANIETMLQLVYMRFEEPRFDEDKFKNLMNKNYSDLSKKIVTAASFMKDTLSAIMANGNPRAVSYDKAYLDKINFNRMKEIYKERFANANDFTFFIVGDVDADRLKPLVAKYIGSLNSGEKKETWVDRGEFFPKGKTTRKIEVPTTDSKASVVIKMKQDSKYSRETVIYHTILASILNLRYTENIREKEGGTYGVSVRPQATRLPSMKLSMDINFDCDPDKANFLKSLVYKELDIIQKEVQQSDLDKVVLNMKKASDSSTKTNKYWMTVLQTYYESNENITDPAFFDDILAKVTTKDIVNAAKKFLKNADVLDIIFCPKKAV